MYRLLASAVVSKIETPLCQGGVLTYMHPYVHHACFIRDTSSVHDIWAHQGPWAVPSVENIREPTWANCLHQWHITFVFWHIHPSIHPTIHACMPLHYITLHCIALHCITLHYILYLYIYTWYISISYRFLTALENHPKIFISIILLGTRHPALHPPPRKESPETATVCKLSWCAHASKVHPEWRLSQPQHHKPLQSCVLERPDAS